MSYISSWTFCSCWCIKCGAQWPEVPVASPKQEFTITNFRTFLLTGGVQGRKSFSRSFGMCCLQSDAYAREFLFLFLLCLAPTHSCGLSWQLWWKGPGLLCITGGYMKHDWNSHSLYFPRWETSWNWWRQTSTPGRLFLLSLFLWLAHQSSQP